mgnify:CR=1 FL=1
MADTTDFKNGLVLKIDNKLMQIVEFQHVKPGKGPAFVRTKLKDVVSGKTVDKTWNAGVKVETATVDRRDMTYLYNDGQNYVVMDDKTFEQYELPFEKFGEAGKFLLENTDIRDEVEKKIKEKLGIGVTAPAEAATEPAITMASPLSRRTNGNPWTTAALPPITMTCQRACAPNTPGRSFGRSSAKTTAPIV